MPERFVQMRFFFTHVKNDATTDPDTDSLTDT